MTLRQLEQHWKMCIALRQNPSKLGARSAADYFGLRRVMKISEVERKALSFVTLTDEVKSSAK